MSLNVPVVTHRSVHGIPFEKCLPGHKLLRVNIARGVSLMRKDIFGTSDPYCRIMLYRDVRQAVCIGTAVRTRTIKRNLNPEWNEEFYFRVNPEFNRLIFELFDENRITRDDFLGYVSISLSQADILTENAQNTAIGSPKPYTLKQRRPQSRVEGKLLIGLSYLPPTIDVRLTQLTDSALNGLTSPFSRISPRHALPAPQRSTSTPSSVSSAAAATSASLEAEPPGFEAGPSEPLPRGWDERVDQNGRTYYVDHIHKRTQWDRPTDRLPEGWERKIDTCGRVYYVDHINHRTTWYYPAGPGLSPPPFYVGATPLESDSNGDENDPPNEPAAEGESAPDSEMDGERIVRTLRHGGQALSSGNRMHSRPVLATFTNSMSMEQMEQAAQTMFLRRHHVRAEDTQPATADGGGASGEDGNALMLNPEPCDAPRTSTAEGEQCLRTESGQPEVARTELGASPEAGGEAGSVGEAAAGVQDTPDGGGPSRRISVVPNDENPLPPGWQMALTENGRPFFINHNDQTTTWKDPRKRGEDGAGMDTSMTTSVLMKDAQRHDLPALGPLPPGWEERVHTNGRIFYINHNARTTQWEDPRLERLGGPAAVPYSRNYRQKYEYFRSRLRAPRDAAAKFEVRVTRRGVFEDSFRLVSAVKKPELLMHRLWIEFLGEKGLDYGGVQREWFFLLSREMFNPYYGLFEYSAADNYTLQINPLSGLANENHLRYFKFIGRVCGMAVYHGRLVDGYFIRPFYKMMLGRRIVLCDMEAVDGEYYRSLRYILESPDPSHLELTFAVDEEHFGETVQVDLIPNGRSIAVTNANKRDYIERIINWRFVSRVESQMRAFLEGFNDLIPLETLQLFDANELELLMCGLQDINVHDWKKHTLYKGEYHANHPVIINFWKTLYTFTNELRSRLLQFVTGTSRVPMNGFVELCGSAGPQKFTIESWGSTDQLPRAHTCFNRLDLPPYKTFDDLRCKLIIAIENAEGFDGVD